MILTNSKKNLLGAWEKLKNIMSGLDNTTQSLAFYEWSHFRISSTDLKLRTTLYSIINSITGKYCSVAFTRMFTLYI